MDPTFPFPQHWSPPPELNRALPRETQITGRGMFNIILGSVFFVASVGLGVWLHNDEIKQAAQTASLHAQGQEVNAEIRRLWHEGKSSTPMVSYTFTANGGVRITGQASVPKDLWPNLQKAGFLLVRYLPSNPTANHPAAWDRPALPEWFPYLIPSVWAIGSIVLLMIPRRQGKVAAEGVPAAGVVTKCFRIKGGWAARYQFRMNDGTVLKGRDRVYSRVEPGSTVCVLYLPDNPRRNYLYPLCLYRVSQ